MPLDIEKPPVQAGGLLCDQTTRDRRSGTTSPGYTVTETDFIGQGFMAPTRGAVGHFKTGEGLYNLCRCSPTLKMPLIRN